MTFNAGLILQGRTPDMLNTLARATQAAGMANQVGQQNALRSLYREQGPGIAAGEQGALNALARMDPQASLGIQDTRLGMENTRDQMRVRQEQLKLARAASGRAAAAHAAQMDDRQRAREQQRLQQAVAGGLQAQTPEEFDAFMKQIGADDYVGQFANRDMLAAQFLGVADAYEMANPALQGPQSSLGKVQADIDAGFLPADTPLRGQPDQVNVTLPGNQPQGSPIGTQGVVLVPDPTADGGFRAVLAEGSPAYLQAQADAAEAATNAQKEANKDTDQQLKLGMTLQNIHLNIKEIEDGGLPVTGVGGEARRTWVGRATTGEGAMAFQNRNNQITDAAALDEIQRMRDNSKTGGAVGQLTDSERVAIGNSITAMNTAVDDAEYLRAAKAYRELALNLAYGEGNWALNEKTGEVIQREASGNLSDEQLLELYGG